MEKVAFSGCTHLDHNNFLGIRGFETREAMDNKIIELHNSVVGKDWLWIHHGDVHLGNPSRARAALEQMNGRKILILGNHDHHKNMKKISHLFDEIHEGYYERHFHIDGSPVLFCMSHYPLSTWNGQYHGSVHLHSHSHNHGVNAFHPRKIDVGIDRCTVVDGKRSYKVGPPLTLADIKDMISKAKEREYTWVVKTFNTYTKSHNIFEIKSPHYEISHFLRWYDEMYAKSYEDARRMLSSGSDKANHYLNMLNPDNIKIIYHTKVDDSIASWKGDL